MRLQPTVKQLAVAESFIDVATTICEAATKVFALHECAVTLHVDGSRPLIVIDNIQSADDRERERWFDHPEVYVNDPMLRALREHHAAVADDRGDRIATLLLPLIEPAGLLGTIRCGHAGGFSAVLRRDLEVLATYASVALARLEITVASQAAPHLSPRQRDTARLAALAFTNREIAVELGVTESTVKKHLKEVFVRLGILRRSELVTLRALARNEDVPVGVTHVGEIAIARRPSHHESGARVLGGRLDQRAGRGDVHLEPVCGHEPGSGDRAISVHDEVATDGERGAVAELAGFENDL